MAIVYKCSHCHQLIGRLEQSVVHTSVLGLDQLSAEEKEKMIEYKDNGDVQIHAICENCEETLDSHPQYHELDYFIQ